MSVVVCNGLEDSTNEAPLRLFGPNSLPRGAFLEVSWQFYIVVEKVEK